MKKIFCLVMCLILALSLFALASCNNNDGTGDSNGSTTESSEGNGAGAESIGGTGDANDGTNESAVTDGSTHNSDVVSDESGAGAVDGSTDKSDEETTDTSKSEGEEDTQNSSTASSAESDKGTTDESGSTDEEVDDNTEKVTVSFVCFMYTPVSGETEVKINKGSVILPEQMPVYVRKGYVMVWSYDMFGDEKWQPTDVFDKDTELFGTWQEVDLFDELKGELSSLVNFQMESTVTNKTAYGTSTHETTTKYSGADLYMIIEANGMAEEIWYVDGVYYTEIDGNMVQQEIPRDEFESLFGSAVVNGDRVFGVDKATVKSVNKTGSVYTVVVDEVKYTQSLGELPVELVYTSIAYTFEFDTNGVLVELRSEYSYTQNGSSVSGTSVSQIINVGTTVVEAPVTAE